MLWAWEMVYALVGMSSIKLASTEIRSVKILCLKNFQLYGPGVKALCKVQKHVGNSGGMFPGKFNTFQFQIGPEGTLMLSSSLLQIIISCIGVHTDLLEGSALGIPQDMARFCSKF